VQILYFVYDFNNNNNNNANYDWCVSDSPNLAVPWGRYNRLLLNWSLVSVPVNLTEANDFNRLHARVSQTDRQTDGDLSQYRLK